MRESVGKAKAAGLAGMGGFGMGGEVCGPLLYSNRFRAEKQEPIYAHLREAYKRSQALAAHHLGLASAFLGEADQLADLLQEAGEL